VRPLNREAAHSRGPPNRRHVLAAAVGEQQPQLVETLLKQRRLARAGFLSSGTRALRTAQRGEVSQWREKMEAFGEHLMPVLSEAGIDVESVPPEVIDVRALELSGNPASA